MIIKAVKKYAEIQRLQAQAQGMGYIESNIAKEVGSAAIAKMIAKAFGMEGVTKEQQKEARQLLRKKYKVDPDVESGFGTGGVLGGGAGAEEGRSSKGVIKKIQEIKKIIVGMAESMTALVQKTDALGEQNKQILKALQGRVREEVGQIMDNASPTAGEDTSSKTPNWNEKLQRWQDPETGIIVKPPSQPVSDMMTPVTPEVAQAVPAAEPVTIGEQAGRPTAVPKSVSEKTNTIFERTMDLVRERYPILNAVAPKEESAPALKDVKSDVGDLQPALEGIAKKEPVKTEMEPDELKVLLTESLEEALKTVIADNPDLLKADGDGGGGLLGGLGGMLSGLLGGKGAKAAGKAAGKAATKVGVKAGLKVVAKSALKKIPIIGAIAGLGFAASRAMSGDWTGAAMEAGSGLAGTIPGVGTAASVGIDAALAARDAGVLGGGPPPAPDLSLQSAIPTNEGAEIIEMNRAIQSGEVAIRQSPADNRPIVQRIVNNAMLPPAKDNEQNIDVGNKENTFNRLIAQDFDHPSTYSALTLG